MDIEDKDWQSLLVYKAVEETSLPDWSQYTFFTAQDAVEWSIIQGGVIVSTNIMGMMISLADEDDFENPEFMEMINQCQAELTELLEQARAWWKERER